MSTVPPCNPPKSVLIYVTFGDLLKAGRAGEFLAGKGDEHGLGQGLEARDVAEVFNNLDLDRQRAIIDAVVEITVRPSGRCGRVFRPEDVDVVIRQAQ